MASPFPHHYDVQVSSGSVGGILAGGRGVGSGAGGAAPAEREEGALHRGQLPQDARRAPGRGAGRRL